MTKHAEVTTNDPQQASFNLSLSMVIKAAGPPPGSRVGSFVIEPSNHWSAAVPHGSTADTSIAISNTGPQPVRITKVTPGGEAFAVKLDTLEEGKRYLLTAKSSPSLPLGKHTQVVKLATESRESPELELQLEATVVVPVYADPATISFDNVPVSQAGYNFSLFNRAVWIRQVRGRGLDVKGVSATLPFLRLKMETKVPGQVYVINVGVDKTLTKGDYKGNIKVETNNPEVPVINVPVTVSAQ